MVHSLNGRWLHSTERNPCPVCGRRKDGSCSIREDGTLLTCHYGSTHHPPEDLKPGAVVAGSDGQRWAYLHDASDGRTALFKPDQPRDGIRSKVIPITRRSAATGQPLKPAPLPITVTLARLPQPAEASSSPYNYSKSQRVQRIVKADGGKNFRCQHLVSRQWKPGAGPDPWPIWQEAEAIAHGNGRWIIEAEGEKCADLARCGGVAAITQPGHAHKPAQIQTRYARLQGAGVAGIVFLADHDQQGERRALEAQEAAAGVGLPLLILPAISVWPDLPPGGSIDDAPGTPAERLMAIEGAIPQRLAELQTGKPEVLATVPSSPSGGKRLRLAPDQVRDLLPSRIGTARFNIRSGNVHLNDGVLSANDVGRLYLKLSNHEEAWPKETTTDALAAFAHANSFDPVRDEIENIAATIPPLDLGDWHRLDLALLNIDDPIAAAFLPKYLVSAVARLFEPGCIARTTPVLIGPQRKGKTELGRFLFGAPSFVEGIGAMNRDSLMKIHKGWGVELSEMNGITRRSDQEELKAFLTCRVDQFRRPYERAVEDFPRRFVFWGTANSPPLRDPTGSSRFVCIRIPGQMLPLDWVIQNRDAIWSRAVEQYRAGVNWDATTEAEQEAIEERNIDHTELDAWSDRVTAYLNHQKEHGLLPVQMPAIFERLGIPTERQSPTAASRIKGIAQSLGWHQGRRRVGGSEPIRGLWPTE